MSEHPIQGLMSTSLENIKQMLGINTIVGDPIHTPSGDTILPISRVGVGFVAGGSEIRMDQNESEHAHAHAHANAHHESLNGSAMPFGGGSGGGVTITPIAFLVVGAQGVKVVPLDNQTHLLDKVIDSAPMLLDKVQSMMASNATSMNSNSGTSNNAGTTSDQAQQSTTLDWGPSFTDQYQ